MGVSQSQNSSFQSAEAYLAQTVSGSCNITCSNFASGINIDIINSVIGGSINIGQTGSTSGQCQLQNNMSAAASATAMASNSAQSGKDKKGQKKGSSAIIITVVGIFVVLVIIFIISKLYTSERDSNV